MSISEEEFLKLAEDFERISPSKAEELLKTDGEVVIFVVRETCPYCRIFIPKLHKIAEDNDVKIYFIHSQDDNYIDQISTFRNKYDMPTVPSLLYKDKEDIKVVSDSSLSDEEIKSFISLN